jgi:hypothetical protein
MLSLSPLLSLALWAVLLGYGRAKLKEDRQREKLLPK